MDFFTVFNNMILMLVRQEVSNLNNSVVVHEMTLAISEAYMVGCAV